MKFTLSWLKDHLDTDASLDAIAERLTAIGLEVEHVDDGAAMRAFRVVRVLACEKHPDADKLKVLSVDAGAQVNGGRPVQVVTNAINAREGLLSILALPGARFPETGETIGEGRLRGVDSHGRMCGAAELGLAGAGEGIADLPADAPVGATVADYAGLGDPVIELNLTPNRPDATSIRGIARDLAASGLGTLKEVPIAPVAGRGACPVNVRLDFPAGRSLARGFALRLLRGVRNGPSPDWMQRRLKAVGLRPVNALVDVTNYIMFDRGRPLHAFDAGKVHGDIVVREAREGETVLALNGRTYTLKPGMCVIADDRGVDGIAGVMGGEESGSDEGTTDVLIESAVWEPLNIARTGRALGINTDARYRFERGVDPALTVPALDLAATMMIELCGGEASEAILIEEPATDPQRIAFPFTEVERLTGLPVEASEQIVLLRRLGFGVEIGEHEALVTPPSWRPDIDGKADLVEEVMRLVGVDAIAPRPLPAAETVGTRILTALQGRERAARRALAARGMLEAVNYSFVSARAAEAFGGGSRSLRLVNPISADLSDMRPSLLPGLIEAATRNAARGLGDGALFEVSSVYHSDEPNGQKRVAGGVRRGTAGLAGAGRAWNGDAAGVSVFDAKADALAALEAVGAPVANVIVEANASPWYHPGRSGRIKLGPKVVLAEFGEFHPKVLKALDASGVLCGFEVFLTEIPEPKRRTTHTKPVLALSPFQPVRRDFAFVVDEKVEALKIVRAVEGADRKVVSDVRVFDVFRGASIGEGLKSVAIEATLRPSDATFSEEDLETISSRIVSAVAKATGATLRS